MALEVPAGTAGSAREIAMALGDSQSIHFAAGDCEGCKAEPQKQIIKIFLNFYLIKNKTKTIEECRMLHTLSADVFADFSYNNHI